jgi:hypothetical protein
MAPGLTFSSAAALVRLKWRAAASKARNPFSGGKTCMRKAQLSREFISFVMHAIKGHIN